MADVFHQTAERLSELLVTGQLKYEKMTADNTLFDHEHLNYQLPLCALTQEQKDYVDPEHQFFNGEYNDVFVNFSSKGSIEFQLNADDRETVFPIPDDVVSKFRYTVNAYDEDRDKHFLCGFTNDLNMAIKIAELAYQCDSEQTDIDEIQVWNESDSSFVGSVFKDKFAFVKDKGWKHKAQPSAERE